MDSNSTDSGGGSSSLYPGESPPLTVITATDQTGVVLIGTALALIFAIVSMIIRLYVRLEFLRSFGRDDVASIASLAFFVVQSSLVLAETSRGFGQTIANVSSSDLVAWQKESYASDLTYLLTLWTTKISVVFLFLRLSPDKKHVLLTRTLLGACVVALIVSIFVIAVRCVYAEPWLFIDGECTDLFVRWQAVTALDIITEVLFFCIATYMIIGLRLASSKKFVVLMAFGLRLPMIAAAALRLYYLPSEISSDDPTLQGVPASICTQIELSYAIISATTPCLRPFMSALNTHYGGPVQAKGTPDQSKISKLSKLSKSSKLDTSDNEISLGSLSNRPGQQGQPGREGPTVTSPRWDKSGYRVTIIKGDQRSTRSDDSKQMIIAKDTEWSIDYGQREQA